jgi:WS/DGAT/MGAT family acyltransferase
VAVREAPPEAAKPLSAGDLAILRLESPTVAGHTLKVVVLGSPAGGRRPGVEEVREHIAERIERAPQLRWKLRMRARGRAEWVEDPGFDLRDHVRSLSAGSAISAAELRRICARTIEGRLDRSKPLWAIDVAEPLEDGGIALVWSLHHSFADGVTAMRLAEQVLWDDDASPGDPRAPARAGMRGGLREALATRRPGRLPAALRRELARAHEDPPFEGPIGTRRLVSFTSVPLDGIYRTARELVPGATVNDVVLALVAAGLRGWAGSSGSALRSLRVRVPVSLHHRAERLEPANRDSFFCVALPLAVADPVERLRQITEQTALRKRSRDAYVLDALLRDMARLAPPVRRVLDAFLGHPRSFALNVSNVRGPAYRPSVMGAPVRALYSIADIDEQHGLRVAVISMADELHFGLCGEPAIVRTLDPLVAGIAADAASLATRR